MGSLKNRSLFAMLAATMTALAASSSHVNARMVGGGRTLRSMGLAEDVSPVAASRNGGRSHGTKAVKRASAKRRNQHRNRLAHRG